MKLIISICFLVTTWCNFCYGLDILYLSLTPSPSHHIWDKTLALALRDRNHKITFATHSPEKSQNNFTVIHFEGVYEKVKESFDYDDFTGQSDITSIHQLYEWFEVLCEWDFATNGFKDLMKLVDSKPHFDLIIFDLTTGHCIYPVIEKLNNPPVVGTSQFGVAPYFTRHFGVDLQTAYIPIYLLPYTDQMTFFERLSNWFSTNYFLLYGKYIFMPSLWKRAQNFYGSDIKHYSEVEKSISILLANFDHNLDYPMSLPPAIIPVGGLHTKREKTLPKDIKQILDEAKHGVILFCLGTNFRSADLKADQRQALIDGLGRLKQIVLWKYEEKTDGMHLPKNFIARPWLPQNDILAHPNLKVFLSHGGGLSTQEAVHHGVPVVTMPFFADQILNSRKFVTRKLGQHLQYGKLTADDVFNTVSEVLNNPIYKQNAVARSKRYRDQPEDPLTRAIWWVEYIARQGGGEHLRIAARDLPWYKVNLLDVWTFVLAVLGLPILVLTRCFCCKKKGVEQKKKTQ